MPTKIWAVGEEVLAADFNAYVQRQVVATFPNAAARNAAIPAPAAGMVCYLTDLQALQFYNTAWRTLPGGLLGVSEMTADSGGVSSVPAPSALQIDPVVVSAPGRRIRLAATVLMQQTSGGPSQLHASLYFDGAPVNQATILTSGPAFHTLSPLRVVSPAAGNHRVQVYVWTDAGVAVIAGSVAPSTLVVEDLGAWP